MQVMIQDEKECVDALTIALSNFAVSLYGHIPDEIIELLAKFVGFLDSRIIIHMVINRQLIEWIPPPHDVWCLLYRASRDGFTSAAFHAHCDGKGPRTVCLLRVRDKKDIIGGFTSVAWNSAGGELHSSPSRSRRMQVMIQDEKECVDALTIALSNFAVSLYGHIPDEIIELLAKFVGFLDSRIIIHMVINRQLIEWIPPPHDVWCLLYRASRDGFTSAAFHAHCDGKGPRTVCLLRVRDKKDIIGGFTSVAWNSAGGELHCDDTAFIFFFPDANRCKKNPARKNCKAVQHCDETGPVFTGPVFDSNLYIQALNCGKMAWCGAHFGISEMEVFAV